MRLIDVDDFIKHWNSEWRHLHPDDCYLVALQNFHTVDAVPVVHGQWVDGWTMKDGKVASKSIDCSYCEGVFKIESERSREYWKEKLTWCPFCGAKMDGGKDDG